MLQYDEKTLPPSDELARQAYLLTGDPQRAQAMAERALGSAREHARRYGPAAATERAKTEMVRYFLAEPGPAPQPATSSTDPEVAAWQAVRRLPARRRAAVVLRYDEALTEEQTAARLGTSAQAVRADVEAALLTMRTALPRTEDPWTRVASALGAAGRGWLDYTRPAAPAAARVPEILAAPRPPRSAQTGATRSTAHAAPERSVLHGNRPLIVGAVVALLLTAVAVIVPRLGGDSQPPAQTTAGAPLGQTGPIRDGRLAVPTRQVLPGLLNWPARGTFGQDATVADAARRAWRAKAPAAEAPDSGFAVLWAGQLEGRTAAVVQALDKSGKPRLAQVIGRRADALTLQHAEPLHAGTQVLSLLPPTGPSGPVRVLVSPEAQVADGLYATNPMSPMPLQRTPVGNDGVSPVLPSPPGTPTCSRVVLMGLDPTNGGLEFAPRILQSGVVSADMLGAMPMEVEVGNAELAPGGNAQPEKAWFTDGERLAPKVPGKGTLVVAALGPRLDPRPLSDIDRRIVSARAYELRRGPRRYVGSVIEVGGRTACSSVLPAGDVPPGPYGWVLRCPVPGGMSGLVHVVGARGTDSVAVQLDPTRSPAGQRLYEGTANRPPHTDSSLGFAVLLTVADGFPCGTGTVRASGDGIDVEESLPVYEP